MSTPPSHYIPANFPAIRRKMPIMIALSNTRRRTASDILERAALNEWLVSEVRHAGAWEAFRGPSHGQCEEISATDLAKTKEQREKELHDEFNLIWKEIEEARSTARVAYTYYETRFKRFIKANGALCWVWEATVCVPAQLISELCDRVYYCWAFVVRRVKTQQAGADRSKSIEYWAKHLIEEIEVLEVFFEQAPDWKEGWRELGFYVAGEGPGPLGKLLADWTADAVKALSALQSILRRLKVAAKPFTVGDAAWEKQGNLELMECETLETDMDAARWCLRDLVDHWQAVLRGLRHDRSLFTEPPTLWMAMDVRLQRSIAALSNISWSTFKVSLRVRRVATPFSAGFWSAFIAHLQRIIASLATRRRSSGSPSFAMLSLNRKPHRLLAGESGYEEKVLLHKYVSVNVPEQGAQMTYLLPLHVFNTT